MLENKRNVSFTREDRNINLDYIIHCNIIIIEACNVLTSILRLKMKLKNRFKTSSALKNKP